MHELTAHLLTGSDLTAELVDAAVVGLVSAEVPDEEKGDFLKALRGKGETAAEMAAFVQALLARAVEPGLDAARLPGPMLDVCGTGGDRLELFNVSTTAMFLLAAGGVCVVKHGNRAITSRSGGADVLEALGVRIDLPPAELRRCVEVHGLGFVFAPGYHPAFRAIAPVRRALAAEGIPTIFNLLGPLLNPARPPFQLVGIFSPVLLPKYAETLLRLGRTRAWAVHGSGMDELSLNGPNAVCAVAEGRVEEFTLRPEEVGLSACPLAALRGGDCAENAGILIGILDGTDTGPRRDLVLLNAAAGFVVAGQAASVAAGLELAGEQVASGRALAKLRALQAFASVAGQ
ncbi:MAG: anthranilate phosphoribosyltransferase [Chthoniobacter sp.]|nr:anthranilate phosphoribosyltransferase [Chthoniobacter sp.]